MEEELTKKKRVKPKNFSAEDKELLMDTVGPFKAVLECQTTNKKSNAAKDAAWEEIATTFNSNSSYKREAKSLRSQYGIMKADTKKAIAATKVFTLVNIPKSCCILMPSIFPARDLCHRWWTIINRYFFFCLKRTNKNAGNAWKPSDTSE